MATPPEPGAHPHRPGTEHVNISSLPEPERRLLQSFIGTYPEPGDVLPDESVVLRVEELPRNMVRIHRTPGLPLVWQLDDRSWGHP